MGISERALIEFQQLVKEKTGKVIPMDEAGMMAHQLVQLIQAIYRPIPAETEGSDKGNEADSGSNPDPVDR